MALQPGIFCAMIHGSAALILMGLFEIYPYIYRCRCEITHNQFALLQSIFSVKDESIHKKEDIMNSYEAQFSPCPECRGQRYVAQKQRIEMAGYRTYNLYCILVICRNCGHMTFYAANPMETIAAIESDTAERHQNEQKAWQERQAAAQKNAQKKRGFPGF